MQQSDHKAFEKLVRMLAANFRQEVSTLFLQAMWVGLHDLPLADLKKATTRAMRECEFMPPVAKLRAIVQAEKARAFPTVEEERARLRAVEEERRRVAFFWGRELSPPGEPAAVGQVVDELVARLQRGREP